MANRNVAFAVRTALLAAGATAAGIYGPAASAQEQELEQIVVTGSRIARQDFIANSPLTTVTAEQIVANADVTLDTFLNTLPQVNPAGTTTSNNPGNGGQANVNLRGLGSNRNLVLIDGRRAMVSGSDLTVDLNTIPAALIQQVEVITGGAGAVYGADAVAGVVNIKTLTNFEGLELRGSFSNHINEWDAQEYSASATLGANFSEDRGNAVFAFEYSNREGMIKSQRPFSAIATSTTGAIPEGVVRTNAGSIGGVPYNNNFSQAAVDQVFAQYGVAPGAVNAAANNLGFNLDGTLFSLGTFNSPLDVQNFRYPIDLSVNTRFYPDFYSYNFDAVNILVLPLERKSFMGKVDYELGGGVSAFAMVGYTEYDSLSAIAPTPVPTGTGTASPSGTDPFQPKSPLVVTGQTVSGSLVVPVTNPFIPADLRTLLLSRTGDDPRLVGSGASEPFLMGHRTLDLGLRENIFNNTVVQAAFGLRGPIPWGENWNWEVYGSDGETEIDQTQTGNVDAQRMQALLESPTGGTNLCAGGWNPFGRNPISSACQTYLEASTQVSTEFQQRIMQGFVSGDLLDLPAGALSVVLGAEYRGFEYEFKPGAAGGAIYGFNSQSPASGENSFTDYFFEALVPLVRDVPFVQALDLSLGYRFSEAEFTDRLKNLDGDSDSDAYKVELSWTMLDYLRARASYQRSARAPNFSELFSASTSAPQYFDPCSRGSAIRSGADAAQVQALCIATGVGAAAFPNFAANPGGQITTQVTGNTELDPETADTITVGFVLNSPWDGALERLRASIDYYSITVKDTILTPDPNVFVADCYNYYGNNPTYSASYEACRRVVRSGNNIVRVNGQPTLTGSAAVPFPGINGEDLSTDGIDIQLDWGMDMPSLGGMSSDIRFSLLTNYLLSFERQERADVPSFDYAGTVSYFGQGLGTSFPEIRANLIGAYRLGDVTFDARVRYIDSMENRASIQFPGEPSFTGVPSVTYLDLGVAWQFTEDGTIRLGVNNATDKEPPLYAPSVQSGTDPSLYDVVGARVFAQLTWQF